MTTVKTLQLTFLNDKGKKKRLSFADAAEGLSESEGRTAMAESAASNVISDKEGDLYKTPQAAEYVERSVTALFDDSDEKSK